jgi:hypothetical protein
VPCTLVHFTVLDKDLSLLLPELFSPLFSKR